MRFYEIIPCAELGRVARRERVWLRLTEYLDFRGIRVSVERVIDGEDVQLVLRVDDGRRAPILSIQPLSFHSTCGVVALPRALEFVAGRPEGVLLEIRSFDDAATFPARVAA